MSKKQLNPKDFPVFVEGRVVKTTDGTPIAKARNETIAEKIADVLNEDDERNEINKWSA